ncbi:hypothetical protein [Actinoallomurus acanthiterrae]
MAPLWDERPGFTLRVRDRVRSCSWLPDGHDRVQEPRLRIGGPAEQREDDAGVQQQRRDQAEPEDGEDGADVAGRGRLHVRRRQFCGGGGGLGEEAFTGGGVGRLAHDRPESFPDGGQEARPPAEGPVVARRTGEPVGDPDLLVQAQQLGVGRRGGRCEGDGVRPYAARRRVGEGPGLDRRVGEDSSLDRRVRRQAVVQAGRQQQQLGHQAVEGRGVAADEVDVDPGDGERVVAAGEQLGGHREPRGRLAERRGSDEAPGVLPGGHQEVGERGQRVEDRADERHAEAGGHLSEHTRGLGWQVRSGGQRRQQDRAPIGVHLLLNGVLVGCGLGYGLPR